MCTYKYCDSSLPRARLCKCCTVDKFQPVSRRRYPAHHVIVLTASNDELGRRRCVRSGRHGECDRDDDVLIILYTHIYMSLGSHLHHCVVHYASTGRELPCGNARNAGCFKSSRRTIVIIFTKSIYLICQVEFLILNIFVCKIFIT